MIIIKYLVRETLKSQILILFILTSVFFCQKLIKVFNAAVDGKVPINLIFSLLGLSIPEIAQIILPLSLLLGLLITLGKLYTENEIIIMYACGISKTILIKSAIILALFTSIIVIVNVMWVGPWSVYHQEKLLAKAKANPGIAMLTQGQFQQMNDNNTILFIENIQGNCFYDIFLAQLPHRGNIHPSIIVANSGQLIKYKNGSQVIILNNGTRFEGSAELCNFRITNFHRYQAIIKYQTSLLINSDDATQMNIQTLWNNNNNYAVAELHWRLTLIFTSFTIALLVVPISTVCYCHGYIFSILLTVLFYLLFFLLQTFIKFNGSDGKCDPIFWMWLVNFTYLMLAILLNLWDTMLIHYIRVYFINKKLDREY